MAYDLLIAAVSLSIVGAEILMIFVVFPRLR
jgi:hypothetical protein